MKEVTIPEGSPQQTVHGVETVVGAYLDAQGDVVMRFEHPPGAVVKVPDAVDSVTLFPGRSALASHPVAAKYDDNQS